ncbi:MAG: RadC family protein [Bacillota bacterium]
MTIKDWPDRDKPRERLSEVGPEALSDAELVAILLGTGSASETALELAQRTLSASCEQYGTSLGFLTESTLHELRRIPGIGPAKAARLRACAELGKRLLQAPKENGRQYVIRCGKDAFEYVRRHLSDLDREHFCILHLNSRNQVIGRDDVSIGTLDATIVHPREIFKNSIKKSAARVILVHNHPSGDPSPSDDDLKITKRMVDAGKLLGIPVADHVIVGRTTFVSVQDVCPGLFSCGL